MSLCLKFYQEFEQHAAGARRPSPPLPPDPEDLGAAGPQAQNTKEAGAPRAPLHRPPAGLFLGTNSRPPARPRHGILKEGRALQKTTHLPLRKTPSAAWQEKSVFSSLAVWTSVGKPRPCWPYKRRENVLFVCLFVFQNVSSSFLPGCLSPRLTRRPRRSSRRMCSWREDPRHSGRAGLSSGHPP